MASSGIRDGGDDGGAPLPAPTPPTPTLLALASSLLGLLQDGAHRRDDRGLGAGGSGRHGDHRRQRGGGGDDGGLGQGHWDGRVPFAFPLLSVCW